MKKLLITSISTVCLGMALVANANVNQPSNWPNYVAMGTSTNLSAPMPSGKIDAISHYADWGNDGNLPTEAPKEKDASIASLVSYANEYNSAPVAIVYTMNLSGSADLKAWDNANDISWGFENVLVVAKQLQQSKPIGTMVINPDFLGTIQQQRLAGTTFNTNITNSITAALKAENIKAKGTIPTFSNDLTGYIQAINYLMSVYYPSVNYGWQENAWANSSNQFVHQSPEFWGGSVEQNANAVSAALMGTSSTAKLPAYQPVTYTVEGKEITAVPSFLAIDKYEADDYNSSSTYSGGSALSIQAQGNFFNYPDWLAYMRFVKQVSESIHSPIMLWQIPGGHLIQNKDDIESPYNASTSGNFFLGSFSTDTDGLEPEMTNPESDKSLQAYMTNQMPTEGKYYPENQSIAQYLKNGSDRKPNGYDWKQNNMQLTADSHVFAILWGGGSTTTVIPNSAVDRAFGQAINDGGWLNDQIQNYYQHPQKLN